MSVLVIAEKENDFISPATLNTITAGKKLGKVDILIAGSKAEEIAKNAAKIDEIGKVIYSSADYYNYGLAEDIAPLIVSLAKDYKYILMPSNTFGKNILPRVAGLLDVGQISDVIKIIDETTFIHPIYAGNILETVKNNYQKIILTIRTTAFDAAKVTNNNAQILAVNPLPANKKTKFINKEIYVSDRPELTQARRVVSGGRGLGSKEAFDKLLVPLSDKLNAAIGASRAAVDSEYISNDLQVGQTGKIVAPELYIAIGISGAIQHTAGMHDSKVIVAINKDPDAPIFNIADYGIVGDIFEIVPELTEKI